MEEKKLDLEYLKLLSNNFPTVAQAATEIINLQAILNLPKGTEHFLADLHGEYQAFRHVLKNASGNIKRKVNELFGTTLREQEKRELCTLIYYPEQKLELVKATDSDIDDWYRITIHQLVEVCRDVSSKYTRSKVRKSLPEDFSYIIQELLHERTDDKDKTQYVSAIIDTIINIGRADAFIVAICNVIQRLAIDQLHVLGDIYDRGPGAHIIMDTLENYHSWDIQWGNHDVLWMGALAGNPVCVCNVIRIALRYNNMETIEEGYGINLVPLATLALSAYKDDPCEEFRPKCDPDTITPKQLNLTAKMHKAISVIQFKAEAALIDRHPNWLMDDRKLLESIDFERKTCKIGGKEYPMTSCLFPTIDPTDPNRLSDEEHTVIDKLCRSFMQSQGLHRHIRTMLRHGCMYAVCNGNLLFHASVPLEADGSLKEVETWPGQHYKGLELMHNIGMMIRAAFQRDTQPDERQYAIDFFMYLWCGPDSPLFDKSKMATFERYFISDKSTHEELKGHYFTLRDNPEVVDRILDAFGVVGQNRHIINGHVPVRAKRGENPIKAGGKLMVIDGGFSSAYHDETGIAGYTLVYHSRGFQLVQHEPFTSAEDAIRTGADIKSTTQIVEMSQKRMLVADTDIGQELKRQIANLKQLLHAYRHGQLQERIK